MSDDGKERHNKRARKEKRVCVNVFKALRHVVAAARRPLTSEKASTTAVLQG